MNGLTDYITQRPWTETITTWYVLVDEAYQRLIAKRGGPLRFVGVGGPTAIPRETPAKVRKTANEADAGGGTRTPDTRIMIPLL